jgi:hypothetical protein
MHGAIPPLPSRPSWRDAHLKHREYFTFTNVLKEKSTLFVIVYESCQVIFKPITIFSVENRRDFKKYTYFLRFWYCNKTC